MKKYLAKHVNEIVVLVLLVPLAIIFGRILWMGSPQPTPTIPQVPEESPSATPTSSTIETLITSPTSTSLKINETVSTVSLAVKTPTTSKQYSLPLPASQASVADVLRQWGQTPAVSLITQDYGGSLGIFVEEINGVKNDPQSKFYWTLYINGKRSSVGASSTIVQAGDKIEWSYEKEQVQ